jgi:hypothetical protein
MPDIKRYRNGKIQTQKVYVITDEPNLTIKFRLIRSAVWFDEHQMEFKTPDDFRKMQFEIFNTLRDKGFIYYDEQ